MGTFRPSCDLLRILVVHATDMRRGDREVPKTVGNSDYLINAKFIEASL